MNGDVLSMLSSVMQDPAAMEKAISMARALSSSGILDNMQSTDSTKTDAQGGDGESKAKNDNFDPTNILSSDAFQKNDAPKPSENGKISQNDRIALLLAIRPYLSGDKASKLDGVIRILKIVSVIEKSGVKLF